MLMQYKSLSLKKLRVRRDNEGDGRRQCPAKVRHSRVLRGSE